MRIKKNRLFQHSTMAALIGGLYEGSINFRELLLHGDFGIGTLDSLYGELIILDGIAYQIREDGNAYHMAPTDTSPYASITFFEADSSFRINDLTSKKEVEKLVAALTQGPNLFYALKVTGTFRIVHTRVVKKQSQPYPPLIEAVKTQPTYISENITGTIVGFWTPEYLQGLDTPGYHLHFIDDLKQVGGHVFDYELVEGLVEVAQQTAFELQLPHTPAFLTSNLNTPEMSEQISTAEKKRE
ncbi:acetolactate decarboxylase [Listeria cornellensis]|nr:acetolactate decarboxylase [Listeria cornellensis]